MFYKSILFKISGFVTTFISRKNCKNIIKMFCSGMNDRERKGQTKKQTHGLKDRETE